MFGSSKKGNQKKKLKIPNKYSHIKKTLNTGMTKNNVILLTNNHVAKKRSEKFKRISAKKLKYLLKNDPLSESIITMKDEKNKVITKFDNYYNYIKEPEKKEDFFFTKDFFLVDLREKKEFEKFHIKTAFCLPFVKFNQDKIPSEIFYYVF